MIYKNILLVGVGGMAGCILRYLTTLLVKQNMFPYATWIVNIVGSLAIGMIMGLAAKQDHFDNWRLFLATGICGGFTTFSAFAWENFQLLQQQRYGIFALYTISSFTLGILAAAAGYWLTK